MANLALVQKFSEAFALIEEATISTDVTSWKNNAVAMFSCASAIGQLRKALTDEVMNEIVLPLVDTKAGFLTDRRPTAKNPHPQPYSLQVLRNCVIDAILKGLALHGNQINIISGQVYITKEGYAALLKKLGVKYIIDAGAPMVNGDTVTFSVSVNAKYQNETISYKTSFMSKVTQYASFDLLAGKATARAIKSLYTYVSGIDAGEVADVTSEPTQAIVVDADVVQEPEPQPEQKQDPAATQPAAQRQDPQPQPQPQQATPRQAAPQPEAPQQAAHSQQAAATAPGKHAPKHYDMSDLFI